MQIAMRVVQALVWVCLKLSSTPLQKAERSADAFQTVKLLCCVGLVTCSLQDLAKLCSRSSLEPWILNVFQSSETWRATLQCKKMSLHEDVSHFINVHQRDNRRQESSLQADCWVRLVIIAHSNMFVLSSSVIRASVQQPWWPCHSVTNFCCSTRHQQVQEQLERENVDDRQTQEHRRTNCCCCWLLRCFVFVVVNVFEAMSVLTMMATMTMQQQLVNKNTEKMEQPLKAHCLTTLIMHAFCVLFALHVLFHWAHVTWPPHHLQPGTGKGRHLRATADNISSDQNLSPIWCRRHPSFFVSLKLPDAGSPECKCCFVRCWCKMTTQQKLGFLRLETSS